MDLLCQSAHPHQNSVRVNPLILLATSFALISTTNHRVAASTLPTCTESIEAFTGKVGDTKPKKKGSPNHRIGFVLRLNGCIKFGQERRRLKTPGLFLLLLLEDDKRFVVSTQRGSKSKLYLGKQWHAKLNSLWGINISEGT